MKKFVYSMMCLLLVMGMASCNPDEPIDPNTPDNPADTTHVTDPTEEPKIDVDPDGLVGEWELYRYTARVEVTLFDTLKLLDEFVDTTFVDTTYKIRLTADSLLMVDGDTIGSWIYDDMESTLTIRSDRFNDFMGGNEGTQQSGGTISTPIGDINLGDLDLPSLDFSEITMDINSFSEHKAKTSFKKSDSGNLVFFTYNYSVRVSLYLRR